MYARTLVSLFALLSLLIAPSAKASSGVVGYYNELQQIKHLDLDYPLVHRTGRWMTFNTAWNTAIQAVVDSDNGYIFFSDEGTGGGNYDTQVRLYPTNDKTPLIAIIENGYNPPFPEDVKVRFFARIESGWKDETKWVWPSVAVDDFLPAKMTIKDLRSLKSIGAQVYVKLSPNREVPIAYLSINEHMTKAVCGGDESVVVADRSPYLHYCKQLENKIFNKIDTVWNKQDGRFRLGKKSHGFLPWERANYPFKLSAMAQRDTAFLHKLDALSDDNEREELIISYAKDSSEKVRLTLESIALDTKRKDSIRMQAICSLGVSINRKSVPVLMDILETDIKQRRGFWGCIIPLLGSLDDRRPIPLLIRIANQNRDHMAGMDHMAIEAIAKLGDKREAAFLESKGSIAPVRLAVMQGLARIADARSAGILVEGLQEEDEPEIVQAAEKGLFKIGKPALSALKKVLSNMEGYLSNKTKSRVSGLIVKIRKKKN